MGKISKPRGSYKKYNLDHDAPIPRQTVFSKTKKSKDTDLTVTNVENFQTPNPSALIHESEI